MRDIWVTSDTHFGHANIIKYCDRPFKDEHHMNEALVDNWNSAVKPGDIVYHLGDVYFRDPSVLDRLTGQKCLILGNHDNGTDQNLQRHFKKILVWRMFPEYGLLMTHVPVHEDTLNVNKCPVNVHGHIHERVLPDQRYINVSVEQTNYTPVHIDTLAAKAAPFRG